MSDLSLFKVPYIGRGVTLRTPTADGTAGQVVETDGAGNLLLGDKMISTVTTAITASMTQTQGQQPLTSDINEVSTVNSSDDVVTMPAATVGRPVTVINNSGTRLQVFPASGDNLGAGVNASVQINGGQTRHWIAIDSTNWEETSVSRFDQDVDIYSDTGKVNFYDNNGTLQATVGLDGSNNLQFNPTGGGDLVFSGAVSSTNLIAQDGATTAFNAIAVNGGNNEISFDGTLMQRANVTYAPTGTAQAIDLVGGTWFTLLTTSATGNLTVTFSNTFSSYLGEGSFLVTQGATARDITWAAGSGITAINWIGTEPTWSSDTNMTRLIKWRSDGTDLYLWDPQTAGGGGGGPITESDITDLGTTVAMVADNLSVFAATTSAQLAGVISDETGSGALVFGTSPTLVTPTLTGDSTIGGAQHSDTVYQNSEPTMTPTGTTQTWAMDENNHQTLNLASTTGNITVTLNAPSGSATGRLLLKQHGTTARDVIWTAGTGVTAVKWFGAEPTWSGDAVSSVRAVVWTFDGTDMYLSAVDPYNP